MNVIDSNNLERDAGVDPLFLISMYRTKSQGQKTPRPPRQAQCVQCGAALLFERPCNTRFCSERCSHRFHAQRAPWLLLKRLPLDRLTADERVMFERLAAKLTTEAA